MGCSHIRSFDVTALHDGNTSRAIPLNSSIALPLFEAEPC